MKNNWSFFLNPLNWVRAYLYNRRNARFDKSSYDLELYLYSKILKNDMLHYGYFEDVHVAPETISLKQLEDAQLKYAEKIIDRISDKGNPVLDAGCGMGGLSALLMDKQYLTETLTPNSNQAEHIGSKYPSLPCHHTKFEDFKTDKQYGTIIFSESLQYIPLDQAFSKIQQLLIPGGRCIITDYFRNDSHATNKSGHLLNDLLSKIKEYDLSVISQIDITENVLPTLTFINMYAERFLLPLRHFAFEKLRYKKGWLYYLTGNVRDAVTQKMNREMASVDPVKFRNEKKYMLFVLEKPLTPT